MAMAVTPETGRWEQLFAERTRGDVGEGIAFVLGFLGRPDLISFAGGFPDPLTFPRERASALLAEFAATGEATAFQYTPTRGLAGHARRGRRAARVGAGPAAGRRRARDHERRDRGARARRQDVPRPRRHVVVEGPTYLGAIMAFRGFEAEVDRRADGRGRAPGRRAGARCSPAACARSSSTRSPTTRTRPACQPVASSGARRSSSSRAGTAS